MFRNLTFRRQLSLAITAGVVLIVLLSSLISTWQGDRVIRRSLIEQGESAAQSLASQSALALLYGSPDNVAKAITATLNFPDVTRVELYYPNGDALLAQDRAGKAVPPLGLPSVAVSVATLVGETDDAWRFLAPVSSHAEESPYQVETTGPQVFGYVSVVQSKSTLVRQRWQIVLANVVIALVCSILLLLGISVLVGRLTRPLASLSLAMRRAERGESDVQAEQGGPRDVAEMAQVFNSMIKVLLEREQALRESRLRYRDVVDNVREVIFQTDESGRLAFLNPAWQEITGLQVEQMMWRDLVSVFYPLDQPVVDEWQRRLKSGENGSCRYAARLERRDGSIRWVEATQRVRYGKHGEYVGTAGTLDDITERKRSEEELEAYRLRLEELVAERTAALQAANGELEAFSYSVSHDLRAPLRAIDGFSRLVREDYGDRLDDNGRDLLQRIVQATGRMGLLIEGMLVLSRVSRGELRRQHLSLSEMARCALQDLQQGDPERQVEIVLQPDLTADGDPALIRAVLDNLLGNAWKFSSKCGQARIEVGETSSRGKSAFYVRDNGAGFDMNYASKLFGAFQRLHLAREFEGTGIGLATVYRIIQRHGGEIWAEAAPGQGATFYFTLPDVVAAS
ncbi:ATP-binding protein [Chitinivorax sp. PXF-14]|uniref:ATP-binding protein n=1 Tax=Chitinivorax sp. PXF-14 TaxID=3230488 RepID=UPI0034654FCE